LSLTVSYAGGPYVDGFFNRGTLIGLTGGNTGLKAPIWSWDDHGGGTATIELFFPLVETPAVATRSRFAMGASGRVRHAWGTGRSSTLERSSTCPDRRR
jgi:hypothetical protein